MSIEETNGLKLMKLRNPWGFGEWTGAFSDEDEEWEKHKGLKEKLKYEKKMDGLFWMTFEDWFTNFNKYYVCQIFSPSWQQYSISGKWEGKTAGGPLFMLKKESALGNMSQDNQMNSPNISPKKEPGPLSAKVSSD